ncbi:MAG TPA: KEOPS complex subunit Pcc1 [Thermoplasmata archaeon]|nr:KEOPS complex subunit Pcc1 [Thermoplasmata archaeon]
MTAVGEWTATIELRRPGPGSAERLARALRPESEREVPRARAAIDLVPPDGVRIGLRARDTGALRAALNTYLGWVSLTDRTAEVAERRPARP